MLESQLLIFLTARIVNPPSSVKKGEWRHTSNQCPPSCHHPGLEKAWALLPFHGFVIMSGGVTSQLWDSPDIAPNVLEVENEEAGKLSFNHRLVFTVLLFCFNPLFHVRSDMPFSVSSAFFLIHSLPLSDRRMSPVN